MARRRRNNRRRRGHFGVLYKLLSVLAICGAIIAALTLFFRVDTVAVTGQERYTQEEIVAASGVEKGDNLSLLNKNAVRQRIQDALPYIERVKRINRKLPDTLLIEVEECGRPLAILQDGYAWLVSPKGKIVEQLAPGEAAGYATISGCTLLAPSVGTKIVLATEYASQQESLLDLLAALEDAEMLDNVDGIRLDAPAFIAMDYAGRFAVEMLYGDDYAYKLKALNAALDSGKIQDNMTGTFDMRREDGRTYFIQDER